MPATLTYSPPISQNPTECLRTNTRRYARYAETHPVQPLKGLREPRAASVSYQASSPDGETWSFPIEGNSSVTPTNVHCSLYIVHCFTFSAKERDSETGLSYFGSRYYSSDLSIWLSVDPQSDKYAYQSGYVYCGNNPIKVFDPNGEDEWEVNEITGRITYYSNDEPDRLYVTTADGYRRYDIAPLDVDRTIMKQMYFDGTRTSFAAIDKGDEMNQMFEYLADNTFVEWTFIGASYFLDTKEGYITSNNDMLFTSHDNTTCIMRGELKDFAAGGLLDFHKHSHPNKYLGDDIRYKLAYPTSSFCPSPADFDNKNSYPMPEVPYRHPYFILRNVKTNFYY